MSCGHARRGAWRCSRTGPRCAQLGLLVLEVDDPLPFANVSLNPVSLLALAAPARVGILSVGRAYARADLCIRGLLVRPRLWLLVGGGCSSSAAAPALPLLRRHWPLSVSGLLRYVEVRNLRADCPWGMIGVRVKS